MSIWMTVVLLAWGMMPALAGHPALDNLEVASRAQRVYAVLMK